MYREKEDEGVVEFDDGEEMPKWMLVIFSFIGYPALAIGETFFILLVPAFVVCVLASIPLAPVAVYIKVKDLSECSRADKVSTTGSTAEPLLITA